MPGSLTCSRSTRCWPSASRWNRLSGGPCPTSRDCLTGGRLAGGIRRGSYPVENVLMLGLEMVQDVDHHLVLLLEMMHYRLDLVLGFDVDLVVVLGGDTVLNCLPVLRHHDDRRRVGGLKAQRQVEQDERVGIPAVNVGEYVNHHPHRQDDRLDDNERPASHHGCE